MRFNSISVCLGKVSIGLKPNAPVQVSSNSGTAGSTNVSTPTICNICKEKTTNIIRTTQAERLLILLDPKCASCVHKSLIKSDGEQSQKDPTLNQLEEQSMLTHPKRIGWVGAEKKPKSTYLLNSMQKTATHALAPILKPSTDQWHLCQHSSMDPAYAAHHWKCYVSGKYQDLGTSRGNLKLFPVHQSTKEGGERTNLIAATDISSSPFSRIMV